MNMVLTQFKRLYRESNINSIQPDQPDISFVKRIKENLS